MMARSGRISPNDAAEVQRIIGHLFWLASQALDIGAMTVFFTPSENGKALLALRRPLWGPADDELVPDRGVEDFTQGRLKCCTNFWRISQRN